MSQTEVRFEEYLKKCAMPQYGKIAVALDHSMRSAVALRRAISLAKAFCSKLYVIHVIPTKLPYAKKAHVAPPAEIHEIQYEYAKDVLSSASKAARDEGVEVEGVLLEGDPAEEIINFAKENGIDLIVVSSKEKEGTLKHLGSVSSKIVEEGKTSVLIER
ncbi:MAG: universal stress protein [Candidatus Methanomethylicia archaeon]|nr:universal stress protein [Candidatus Methanomethylicia archaeon]MCQ5373836.1 universal stress protein [Candidatus Methanomethylicia archaeon]NHV61273.1 universal stress protein [Candidatus Verstraetearchaeota archaeon]